MYNKRMIVRTTGTLVLWYTTQSSTKKNQKMEIGFCDSSMNGFFLVQPADQLERWTLPIDNGTHLTVPWRPDKRLCGKKVSSMYVDVKTSTNFVNFFMGIFGSFPQDQCDPAGSKGRSAVNAQDTNGGPCPLYTWNCDFRRELSFELPGSLRRLVQTGVQVSTIGYGTISPPGNPAQRTNVTFWCHTYRKARGGAQKKASDRPQGVGHKMAAFARRLGLGWGRHEPARSSGNDEL